MFIFNKEILNQIQSLNDNDIEKYILTRTNLLENSIDKKRETIEPDSMKKTAIAHGYISKETEICAEYGAGSVAIGGFLVNDNEIYKVLINNIKQKDDLNSLNDVLQSIQSSIDDYFGRTS